MTTEQIKKELNLSEDYIVYEQYETDKIVFVSVGKEKNPPQVTSGLAVDSYAKWKSKRDWSVPQFPTDVEVYKEIHDCKNLISHTEK